MRPEYEAIIDAGFDLQLDCPDLAMSRHTGYQDMSEAEFLRTAAANVEALNAATAMGDDRLQKRSQGLVIPDTFTHGTSEQRYNWFKRGMDSGEPAQCNTFSGTL